jgi:probable rRNA maturation factor
VEVILSRQRQDEDLEIPGDLRKLIEAAVDAALHVSGYSGPETEVTVLLIDDPGIAQLHNQYMLDPTPTDVLSWSAREGEDISVSGGPQELSLGDIVVSEDTAREQAKQYGQTTEKEIALLVIHGMLHITGYDDVEDESRRVMREMEAKAMARLA